MLVVWRDSWLLELVVEAVLCRDDWLLEEVEEAVLCRDDWFAEVVEEALEEAVLRDCWPPDVEPWRDCALCPPPPEKLPPDAVPEREKLPLLLERPLAERLPELPPPPPLALR